MVCPSLIRSPSLQLGGCFFPFNVLPLRNVPTVGDDTITYAFDPEASRAASFDAFAEETFANGLVSAAGDFGGTTGCAAGEDSFIGSLGIGGAIVGETIGGVGGGESLRIPTPLFRCNSKLPIFNFSSAMLVSSQTSDTNASKPLGKVDFCTLWDSNGVSEILSEVTALDARTDVLREAFRNRKNDPFLVNLTAGARENKCVLLLDR